MKHFQSGGKRSRHRKPGQEAARFKIDDDTGKMIIDEDSDSDSGAANAKGSGETDVAGTAYRENITSADGFIRGPHGRVKFNKDTKKRRRQTMDVEEDVEMGDEEVRSRKEKKDKRKPEVKFGHEFKAKVHTLFFCWYVSF